MGYESVEVSKKNFNIPAEILTEIRKRDKKCAYCHKAMVFPYERVKAIDSATIEHLNREGPFNWEDGLLKEDIVICCVACNSSRGQKLLADWFASPYCAARKISAKSVTKPVSDYLLRKSLT